MPWRLPDSHNSFNLAEEEPEKVERGTTSQKEAETLEFEAWLDCRNFIVWRMNFRSEVRSDRLKQ